MYSPMFFSPFCVIFRHCKKIFFLPTVADRKVRKKKFLRNSGWMNSDGIDSSDSSYVDYHAGFRIMPKRILFGFPYAVRSKGMLRNSLSRKKIIVPEFRKILAEFRIRTCLQKGGGLYFMSLCTT